MPVIAELPRVPDVRVEADDGVVTVTFDRLDKKNALSNETMDGLPILLEALVATRTVRSLVLTGSGGVFCAGGDLETVADADRLSDAELLHRQRHRHRTSELLHDFPSPTIAAVGGVAAGAGMSLALACDVRVASASARFVPAFSAVGFCGDFGVTKSLPRLVGPGRARLLLFANRSLDAEEAREWGLVDELVEEDALSAAVELARRIASMPPLAIVATKEALRHAETAELEDVLNHEAAATVALMRTHDTREAIAAFSEKRPPSFEGR